MRVFTGDLLRARSGNSRRAVKARAAASRHHARACSRRRLASGRWLAWLAWLALGLALGLACSRPPPRDAPLDRAALEAWLHPGSDGERPPQALALGASADTPADTPAEGAFGAAPDAELDGLLELVARRRGLDFRERPPLDAVPRVELVERAWHWIETQTSAERRDTEAELLVRLELVPAEFAWEPALRALLARRLQAFYDPATRRIVIDRALPARDRWRVLAHELVHALVDQHHALGARLVAAPSADRQAALLTLAEGDAEALVAQLRPPAARAPSAAGAAPLDLDAAPDGDRPLPGVLARSLSAAYADGRAALQRVLERGDFAEVDALYREPPAGTHQLLAPGFPERRPPPPSLLPGATPPGPAWTLRHSDVLGAQAWRSVLEEWLPPERAAELAQAWDGDRLEAFERGGERLLMWQVRSRAELAGAVAKAVSHGLGLSEPAGRRRTARATGLSCRAQRDGGVMGRWVQGRSLVIAALTGAAQTVQCESLAAWTIPAAPRQTQRRDLGFPRLIGPS